MREKNKQVSQEALRHPRRTPMLTQNELFTDAIVWDQPGLAIVITNLDKMENEIIPLHFSLRKFSSFVRQLHLYDFHKRKSKRHELVFYNPYFQRDQR